MKVFFTTLFVALCLSVGLSAPSLLDNPPPEVIYLLAGDGDGSVGGG